MSEALMLDLRYPSSAFLYHATKPKVLIDGVERPVEGWGTQRFDLPAGAHRVEVYVPYTLPRRAGRAALDVTVPPGGTLELEYLAPTLTFARGSIGAPGQQTSAGASAVRTANVVALVLIVVALGVIIALG